MSNYYDEREHAQRVYAEQRYKKAVNSWEKEGRRLQSDYERESRLYENQVRVYGSASSAHRSSVDRTFARMMAHNAKKP